MLVERYETERQSVGDHDEERGGAKEKRKTARRGTKVRCRREEGGGDSPCPPSYHAASMGPLIFAALRFCLALSTLHTSTADRRYKTLYRDSVEREKEKGQQGRKGIARESLRADGCIPLCPAYIQRTLCMHNVVNTICDAMMYISDGFVPFGGSMIRLAGSRKYLLGNHVC